MKIAPLLTNDPWFPHVTQHGKAYVESLSGVPVEATILVEQVGFTHAGADEHYRPRLHLQGRLQKLEAPTVELPYGVQEMEFHSDHGPLADAFYEFTAKQLARLALKGYFESGFEIPSAMTGIEYVLPATARMMFVAPSASDEPPVLFVEVENINALMVSEMSSGYDLSAYFPDMLAALQTQRDLHAGQREAVVEGVDFTQERDLFADEQQVEEPQEPQEPVIEAEPEQIVSDEVERVYREQIAARLEAGAAEELTGATTRGASGSGVALPEDGVVAFEMDDSVDGSVLYTPDLIDFDEDDEEFEAELERSRRAHLLESSPIYATVRAAAPREAHDEGRLAQLEAERNVMTRRAMRHQRHIYEESEVEGSNDLELS